MKTVQDRYSYFGGKDPWEWTIHQTLKQFFIKGKYLRKYLLLFINTWCFFFKTYLLHCRPKRESSSQMVFVLWSKTWSMSGSAKFQGNFRLLKRKTSNNRDSSYLNYLFHKQKCTVINYYYCYYYFLRTVLFMYYFFVELLFPFYLMVYCKLLVYTVNTSSIDTEQMCLSIPYQF